MEQTTERLPFFRKGQVAMEFIIMISMATLITISFLAVLNPMITQRNEEQRDELFSELGQSIQKEFLLAGTAKPGYQREFFIPPPELNHSYEIYEYIVSLNNTDPNSQYVVLATSFQTYNYPVPASIGSLHKGLNSIQNREGRIYVNS